MEKFNSRTYLHIFGASSRKKKNQINFHFIRCVIKLVCLISPCHVIEDIKHMFQDKSYEKEIKLRSYILSPNKT